MLEEIAPLVPMEAPSPQAHRQQEIAFGDAGNFLIAAEGWDVLLRSVVPTANPIRGEDWAPVIAILARVVLRFSWHVVPSPWLPAIREVLGAWHPCGVFEPPFLIRAYLTIDDEKMFFKCKPRSLEVTGRVT